MIATGTAQSGKPSESKPRSSSGFIIQANVVSVAAPMAAPTAAATKAQPVLPK